MMNMCVEYHPGDFIYKYADQCLGILGWTYNDESFH